METIEKIIADLFNALSVRAIRGHENILFQAKKEFLDYFETGKKEIVLYIKDKNHAFGINILSGEELLNIISVTEKNFTFLSAQNQQSFELTKEKVTEQIHHNDLIRSYLIESREDANLFFKKIFKDISKKTE